MSKKKEDSIIEEIYKSKRDEFSKFLTQNSKKYNKLLGEMEEELKSILRYVPDDLKIEITMQIEDFMFGQVMTLAEFWESNYYKLGFIDGVRIKKEIKCSMEEFNSNE